MLCQHRGQFVSLKVKPFRRICKPSAGEREDDPRGLIPSAPELQVWRASGAGQYQNLRSRASQLYEKGESVFNPFMYRAWFQKP